MRKIKIGKKAQISETLTWFVAFLIIFFIMLIFIGATLTATAANKISGLFDKMKSFLKDSKTQVYLPSQSETLFAVLKTPVEFELKDEKLEKTIQELVIYSLEPYVEKPNNYIKEDEERGIIISTNNDFGVLSGGKERAEILFEKSREILGEVCDGYIFILPQGILYKEKGENPKIVESIKEAESDIGNEKLIGDYNQVYSAREIHYENYWIKIKYKQLGECNSE